MTLIEAFREVGPVEGDAAQEGRRREAATRIYEELQKLAAKTWPSIAQGDREDVASEVLIRMMNNGPRGYREDDPAYDGALRAYLRTSIKNGLKDLVRRGRHIDMPEEFNPVDPGPEPAELAGLREAQQHLERLEWKLFDELVPELASRSRSGRALIEIVAQLRDIRDGRLQMEEVVDSECGGEVDDQERKKARNRIDQRFSRLFARVHEAIEDRERRGEFDGEEARGLKLVLESLRLRQ